MATLLERVGETYRQQWAQDAEGKDMGDRRSVTHRLNSFNLVTLAKNDGTYIAVCSVCAMSLIRSVKSHLQMRCRQRQQEILYGQMRLPGM